MSDSHIKYQTIADLADTNPETLGIGANPQARFQYIDLSSVSAGVVKWNDAPEFTLLTAPSRARRVLREGDVLFGTVRPNLQSHGYIDPIENNNLIGSTGFSVIRAKHGLADSRYLFHCVMGSAVTAQANRHAVGSSYPALNDSDVRRFEVFAPPLGEQSRIAEILDTLDTTIRQTEAIIEKLKQVKQGLLHDLLTRGIDANGELRPPQSEAPQLYKESVLGWIPREWESFQLQSISTLITSGSRGWAAHYVDMGALFLRSQNVRMGYLDLGDRQHVAPPAGGEGQRTKLEKLDLLITITGNSVGNVAHTPEDWNEIAFVSQHVGLIRFMEPQLVPLAMHYLVHGAPGNQQLIDAQYGQSKPGLNLENLRSLCIPVPPKEEGITIVERITCLYDRISNESRFASQLRELKSGLMDDLLTGRVRVTGLVEQEATA